MPVLFPLVHPKILVEPFQLPFPLFDLCRWLCPSDEDLGFLLPSGDLFFGVDFSLYDFNILPTEFYITIDLLMLLFERSAGRKHLFEVLHICGQCGVSSSQIVPQSTRKSPF